MSRSQTMHLDFEKVLRNMVRKGPYLMLIQHSAGCCKRGRLLWASICCSRLEKVACQGGQAPQGVQETLLIIVVQYQASWWWIISHSVFNLRCECYWKLHIIQWPFSAVSLPFMRLLCFPIVEGMQLLVSLIWFNCSVCKKLASHQSECFECKGFVLHLDLP